MTGIFFKAGEFASLCQVKKDTLFHYDHIGILKPEKIGENGYRYYSVKQFYTFDLISSLKGLGMSLGEIKAYLDKRNPQDFLSLLEHEQDKIKKEQARLKAVNQLLSATISHTKLGTTLPLDTLILEEQKEEYYLAVEAPDFTQFNESAYLLRSRQLLALVRHEGAMSLPLGDIITKNSLLTGKFIEDYYYCKISPTKDMHDVKIKPAGRYITLLHRGDYDSLQEAYEHFTQRVLEAGYMMKGDLYEEDLLHYMSVSNSQDYVMKFSLQVE